MKCTLLFILFTYGTPRTMNYNVQNQTPGLTCPKDSASFRRDFEKAFKRTWKQMTKKGLIEKN